MNNWKSSNLTPSERNALIRDGFYLGIPDVVSSTDMTGMMPTPGWDGMFDYGYMRPLPEDFGGEGIGTKKV